MRDPIGQGEARAKRDQVGFAMHQNPVEGTLHRRHDLLGTRWRALGDEDVPYRGEDRRPRRHLQRGVDQGRQLESEGASAEGKTLDDENLRLEPRQGGENEIAPANRERLIDRASVRIDDGLEAGIARARRWKLKDLNAARFHDFLQREPAGEDRRGNSNAVERLGERDDPLPMADAEEVLHMEEHARAHHRCLRFSKMRRRISSSRSLATSISCSATMRAAAAAPNARHSGAEAMSSANAAPKAMRSPGGVKRPVSPSATISGTPPLAPASTATPAACASRRAMP